MKSVAVIKWKRGSQFSIAEFGGSKTQFIELIKNIIIENKERVFNSSIDLIVQNLGEKIEHETAIILTR